jgi:hypothetical protein
VQTVTGGISDDFTSVAMGIVSNHRCMSANGNCLFRSINILLVDEGKKNLLRQKVVQEVYAVSESQIIQP